MDAFKKTGPVFILLGFFLSACNTYPKKVFSSLSNTVFCLPKNSDANLQIPLHTVDERQNDTLLKTYGTIGLDQTHEEDVVAPVSGKIVAILVHLGDNVALNTPLIKLFSPDILQSENDFSQNSAQALYYAIAEKRSKALLQAGAETNETDAEIQASAKITYTNLQASTSKLKIFQTKSPSTDHPQAQITLLSPVAGKVTQIFVTNGYVATGGVSGEGSLLLHLQTRNRLVLTAFVDPEDLTAIYLKQPVTATSSLFQDISFRGLIEQILPVMDTDTRKYRVRIGLDNTKNRLIDGLRMQVSFVKQDKPRLEVPRQSIAYIGRQTMVFVPQPDPSSNQRLCFDRRAVEVDEAFSGDWVPVLYGLSKNDKIVRHTSHALVHAGMKEP